MKGDVIIFESKYWDVILFSDQAYLGRCVIGLKRVSPSMSHITSAEWVDFHESVLKPLESAFKKAFGAEMFNWTCLMNHAYKKTPPQPWVHWHFRPRYRNDVDFAGIKFRDLEFSHHYDRKRKMIVSDDVLEQIAKEVRKYL